MQAVAEALNSIRIDAATRQGSVIDVVRAVLRPYKCSSIWRHQRVEQNLL